MAPFKPKTLEEQGIEEVFDKRRLDLDLFKLLVKTENDTAIARILSQNYQQHIGIPINIAPRTIKRYRGLL